MIQTTPVDCITKKEVTQKESQYRSKSTIIVTDAQPY